MKHYDLSDWESASVFEVMLPKRLEYYEKLKHVLEALFEPEMLIESVTNNQDADTLWLRRLCEQEGWTTEQFRSWIQSLTAVFRGYSIYEVDGRFYDRAKREAFDERVLIIRFIIHNTQVNEGMPSSVLAKAKEAVSALVLARFAEELGKEKEVWATWGSLQLQIARRISEGSRPADSSS